MPRKTKKSNKKLNKPGLSLKTWWVQPRKSSAIVVEDDLVVNHFFLGYLNEALERYINEEKEMQVPAYMFTIEQLSERQDAFFLPINHILGLGCMAAGSIVSSDVPPIVFLLEIKL